MATILFPRKGDRLRAHSLFFQRMCVAASGIGVVSGFVPSRASASSVAVSSGTYRNINVLGSYAGTAGLTGFAAAPAGELRFDLVVYDVSDTTLKRIAGVAAVGVPITDFLELATPSPPELASASQILVAVVRVSSSGIEAVTWGHYATDGIASMVLELPTPYPLTTAVQFTATARVLGRKTASGGAGEECTLSEILDFIGSAARGDILYRGASTWARRAKGTSGQVFVQGADDPAWTTRPFNVAFSFGDGISVMLAGSCSFPIPIASKIITAEIRSYDSTGALLSGSVTCTLYKHARDAAIGSTVDTFAISSANNMQETGLNIAVAAGNYLTIVTSGITTCKQIVCTLTLEPT